MPRNLLPWLSGAFAVLLLGALGWGLYGRRGPAIDTRSPLQRALDELDEIDARGYPATGNYTRHYALMTDTLRRYVELTYGVPALDMTTRELKYALMRTSISPAYRDELVGLLANADLVKFARLTPTPEAAHDVTTDARDAAPPSGEGSGHPGCRHGHSPSRRGNEGSSVGRRPIHYQRRLRRQKMNFQFASPWALLLLAGLPVVWWWTQRRSSRMRPATVRFSSIAAAHSTRRTWRMRLRPLLPTSALADAGCAHHRFGAAAVRPGP